MMSKKVQVISMVEATLPPGFRFHPKDEELISDYLSNKISNSNHHLLPHLPQVDLNHCEPWDLPEAACVGGKEWYFYSQRDRKYATGLRTNRATVSGYWKATGKDRCIHGKGTKQIVGMRKTLVFYLGRAPKGKKTDWVMHEFRLQSSPASDHHHSSLKDQDWVLCRVFCKNRDQLVGGKQSNSKVNNEDTLSCSSSLPPLMDPNYSFSFGQSQPASFPTTNNNNIDHIFSQQVPCFSINTPPDMDIIFSNTISISPADNIDDAKPISIPSSSSITQSLDHYSCCEKKEQVFKAILSRFNEMDHEGSATSLSFGEGISDQSFLSDAALPVTMWYP